MEEVQKELQAKLDAMKAELSNEYASKETLAKAEETMKELKATIDAMTETQKAELDALKEVVKQFKDNNKADKADNFSEFVEKQLVKNLDQIKATLKGGFGMVELDAFKAVENVTNASGTVTPAFPANFYAEQAGVPNVALRRATILDHVNTFSTSRDTLPYIEAEPKEGDFAIVAEGGVKPQLDLKWVTRYAEPQKYAGWIKVTEEVVQDIPRLRDMVVNYLRDKHDLFKEKTVYNFLNANSTAYVTGGPLAGSVVEPNIMDVVGALESQIINTPNYVDEPEFLMGTVLMNHADFFRYFRFAKDALGRPLFADGFSSARRVVQYNGYTFVASSLVTAGSIIGYDADRIDVTNYIPYNVSIGWVNDDFIKNQFVILGESRGHVYIKNHDKRAFVKGSISAIIADLKAPEPTTGG